LGLDVLRVAGASLSARPEDYDGFMPQFRKRPVVIEAEQFLPDQNKWPEGVVADAGSPTGYSIGTLENTAQGHEVTPGDWIIVGVAGERYPCKSEIFAATYDAVQI
jgi:hypothetical protein